MDRFDTEKGWVNVWGDEVFEHEGITISASEQTTGGLSFLDGTLLWKNYVYTSEVIVEKGLTVTLLGRYQDASDYVSCTFTDGGVLIQIRRSGTETVVAQEFSETFTHGVPVKIFQRVENNIVSCGIQDNLLISFSVEIPGFPLPETGGIGLKTWDPQTNNSSAYFLEIQVDPL